VKVGIESFMEVTVVIRKLTTEVTTLINLKFIINKSNSTVQRYVYIQLMPSVRVRDHFLDICKCSHKSLGQLVVLSECSPEFSSQEACVGFSHWVGFSLYIITSAGQLHTYTVRMGPGVCVAKSWFTPH